MEDALRLKRLRYRSWHRGCKETDLVFGPFSEEKLPGLPAPMLEVYERLLEEHDAEIWDWLVGKAPAPAEYDELLAMMKPSV